MQVTCPSCGHVLTIPPEKAAVPNLKARCRCGSVFPVAGHEAAAVTPAVPPTAARAASSAVPAPSKVAPAATDRVAAIRAANARAATAAPAVVMAAAPGASLSPPPLPPRPAGVPAGAPLRTAGAVARPAAAVAARVAASDTPASASEKPRTVPIPWRRCQNHAQVRSEHVCPKCTKGFCDPCPQKVQGAAICPSCEGLCVAAAVYEEIQDKAKRRDRSMMDEIGVIVRYPLVDPTAYVLLALFTWFFGLFASFAFIAAVLSKGVLTWYSFNAVAKVSIGSMRDVMPDFRDWSEIVHAMRLSLAALVISAGPLFLCLVLIPGTELLRRGQPIVQSPRLEAVHAQPPSSPAAEERADEAEDEPSSDSETASPFEADRDGRGSVAGPLAMLGIVVAALWMVAYLPVALTVAALSKSIFSTVNPLIGADTIKKMGGTYWQALAIYVAIVLVQAVTGWGLRLIPLAGGLVASFVDAYAALAIGCTLGMAVFKKGAELGWD
jgi:hypothetical protein